MMFNSDNILFKQTQTAFSPIGKTKNKALCDLKKSDKETTNYFTGIIFHVQIGCTSVIMQHN